MIMIWWALQLQHAHHQLQPVEQQNDQMAEEVQEVVEQEEEKREMVMQQI